MSSKIELELEIERLGQKQPWNHNIRLAPDVETRPGNWTSFGKNEIKWERIKSSLEKIDISSARILDIGCNEGFFSLKLAERCAEVVGLDIDKLRIEKAQFVKEYLNVSNVEYRSLDIFSDEFERLEPFDLCLCLGFLHRIPDPYTALARLGKLSAILIIEWKVLKHGPHWDSFAKFTPGEYREDDYYGTQFWLLSFRCLEEILKRQGFRYFHRIDDPTQTRAIMVTGKTPNNVFDQPDEIGHRGRIRTFLSHTKSYLQSVKKIMSGEINS